MRSQLQMALSGSTRVGAFIRKFTWLSLNSSAYHGLQNEEEGAKQEYFIIRELGPVIFRSPYADFAD